MPRDLHELPTLFGRDSTGRLRYYDIIVEEGGRVYTSTGLWPDGTPNEACRVCREVNVGKKNYRSADQQAEISANDRWKDLQEAGWSTNPALASRPVFGPMLAVKYDPSTILEGETVALQPKLDGMRAFAYLENGEVILRSRGGKTFELPHVQEELKTVLEPGLILDGELYCHGFSFQTLASWIKRQQPESLQIGFHIFDYAQWDRFQDEGFLKRYGLLQREIPLKEHKSIFLVNTAFVESSAQIWEYQGLCLELGYEGAMVRTLGEPYEMATRTAQLQKVKKFVDSEFKIVEIQSGEGRMIDHAMFICETDSGRRFRCAMNAPSHVQMAHYQNRENLIGKQLTVKYQELSLDGVPRFPRALRIRDIDLEG
jgi:ATP-dependent DNA ligase